MSDRIDGLLQLERLLQKTLKPVSVRAVFVETLRQKLLAETLPASPAHISIGYIAVIFVSVISSLVLLLVGFRALLTLLATVGLIKKVKSTKLRGEAITAQVAG